MARRGPATVAIAAPRDMAYVQSGSGGPVRLCAAAEVPASAIRDLAPDEAIARLARIAADRLGTGLPRPAPLYVRAADAAPAADPPPTILP